MLGFGKAKYGKAANESNFQKFYRLEADKELVARILPPMKSLESTDKWAVYHSVHYGYRGVDKKDPSKTTARPFRCVEQKNLRNGMITQTCPECMDIQRKKATLEERTASLAKRTDMTEEEKETILAPLKSFLKEHNVDRKWYINIMLQDGSFGVLQISHRLKKQVDALLERIFRDEGVDPLDPEGGVWLSFRRTGRKLDAVDTVEPVYVKEEIGGRKVNVLKSGALTLEKGREALSKCPDLTEVSRVISLDQINLLVGSSGDPEEVDRILAISSSRTMERSASPALQPKAFTPVSEVSSPDMRPSDIEDDEAFLMAKLQALRSKKQGTPVVAAAPVVAATPTPPTMSTVKAPLNKPVDLGLPEDKFLELFEDKG